MIRLGNLVLMVRKYNEKPTIYISSDGGKSWAYINFRGLLEIVKLYYEIQDIMYPQTQGHLGRWFVVAALVELARWMDVERVISMFIRRRNVHFEEVEEM